MSESQEDTRPNNSENSLPADSPADIQILESPQPIIRKRAPYRPRKPKEPKTSIEMSAVAEPAKSEISVAGMVGLWAGVGQTLCAVFRLKPLDESEIAALAAATVPVAKKYAADFAYTEELVLAGTILAVFGMRESTKPKIGVVSPPQFSAPTIPRREPEKSFFSPGTLEGI